MLDLTDNIVGGGCAAERAYGCSTAIPTPTWWSQLTRAPPTLSDTANEVSAEYRHLARAWATPFASGGSAGYDHKALGITAKGAWESAKRHFAELGQDVHDRTVHGDRHR